MTSPSAEARELYASIIAAQGTAWLNTANSIRAGYDNFWIAPALKAIDQALRSGPQSTDEDPDSPD